jgi:hypothetical protein
MNEAKVYIVRIWSSAAKPAGFRAAVRAVDRDEARLFSEASLLGGYFEAELAAEETGAAPGTSDPKPSPSPKG